MKYESLDAVSHEEAEALARGGDVEALSRAVVALALSDGDLPWTTAFLLSLVSHESANVRGNALLGFGHLARRFRTLPTLPLVASAIRAGLADTDAWVRGQADAAADDFQHFVGPLESFSGG
jgi:hypothetical protein